ncbi:ribonuclease H-like domain-containing protein [Tanacetum coccineum]
MTNPDQPSAPPTLTLVEKLYAVHNINTLVPEKLDLAESNYSTWSYFFKGHCSNFGVLKHIEGSSTQSSTSTPPTDDWITADSIVKSWIFLTLSSTLRKRLIKANPKTAKDAWDTIEAIFQDNKRTRVVALKGELHDVVTYAINGLSDKYGSLAQIIAHKEPFPDLSTVRSMVSTEEMRIRNKSPSLSVSTNSSAPQVLLTETPHRVQDTRTNKERDNRNNNKTEVHASHTERIAKIPTYRLSPRSRMHTGIVVCDGGGWYGCGWEGGLDLAAQQQLLSLLQAQNTLLAQYGLSTISIPRTPIGFNNSGQRIVPAQPSAQQLMTHGLTPNQQALFTNAVQNTAHANWHMDTGASSHLNSSAHNLIHQLDVKNAFLHESLSETVYMYQTPGFRDPRHPDHVCLLQRSLYGLKQAPRAWFQRFAAYAARVGFLHSRCDSSLFIYRQGSDTAYLLLYVDDIVLTASSTALLQRIIASLHSEFSMTDLGPLNFFLGVSVTRNTSGMSLSQQIYATEAPERAGMLICNPCRTPVDTDSKLAAAGDPVSDPTLYRRLAGALQYLTFTRSDISYAVQ